ncbi:MAG: hypothetical protein HY998_05875 [candidate division NC10 bacterium]|nr:hypothetical protein [candidate division NC10 bacterium]
MPELTAKKARFHHYKSVSWVLPGGPLKGEAYVPVVEHDNCRGCLVCQRTIGWFMEFARLARGLIGINLRDCLHWSSLFDNPQPLIVPTSNLQQVNRDSLTRLREAYYALPPKARPHLTTVWPEDRHLTQSQRFEDRLAIVKRMVELWEDGQYIGWPS